MAKKDDFRSFLDFSQKTIGRICLKCTQMYVFPCLIYWRNRIGCPISSRVSPKKNAQCDCLLSSVQGVFFSVFFIAGALVKFAMWYVEPYLRVTTSRMRSFVRVEPFLSVLSPEFPSLYAPPVHCARPTKWKTPILVMDKHRWQDAPAYNYN